MALPSLDELKNTSVGEGAEATFKAVEIFKEKFGAKRLSKRHEEVIWYIAGRLTHLCTGHAHRRFGSGPLRLSHGLPCGGGKTLTAKSWIAAVYAVDRPWSVTYAASEVEELCRFRRELIEEFNVPAEKVGILHSYKYDPERAGRQGYASMPATPESELASKQFLLVTHNLIRSGDWNLWRYNDYKGHPRNVIIYDETLLVADAWTVKVYHIDEGRDWLRRQIERHEDRGYLRPLLDYMQACLDALDSTQPGSIVTLPELLDYDGLQPDEAKSLLPKDAPASVNTILQATGSDVRLVNQGGQAAAWFVLKVPPELQSVMVLDASHTVRLLATLGDNLTKDHVQPHTDFDYSALEIEYFKCPAGRRAIEAECHLPSVRQRSLARKLADWIKSLPETEQVLIWTFKTHPRKVNITRVLLDTLAAFDVDTSRVHVLTHGSNKGTNRFAGVPNVAYYGVWSPDEVNVAASVMGQLQDLEADLSDLKLIHYREILHELYQEISRSGVREIYRGRAGRARVFIGCWWIEEVLELLGSSLVFPGATMTRREDLDDDPAATRRDKSKSMRTALKVAEFLATVPTTTEEVTTRRVKANVAEMMPFEVTKQIWGDALLHLDSTVAGRLQQADWYRDGTRFRRITAMFDVVAGTA